MIGQPKGRSLLVMTGTFRKGIKQGQQAGTLSLMNS